MLVNLTLEAYFCYQATFSQFTVYVIRNEPIELRKYKVFITFYLLASEASREVTNWTEIKNLHTHLYVSICLASCPCTADLSPKSIYFGQYEWMNESVYSLKQKLL